MKKRLFALVMVLCLVLCALPLPARAAAVIASGTYGDNFTWYLDEIGTLLLQGEGFLVSDDSWSSIEESPWNDYRYDIKKLYIGEGITGLYTSFFSNFPHLQDVSLPSTLIGMSNGVFDQCTALQFLTVDNGNPAYSSVDNVLFTKDMTTLILYPRGLSQKSYTIPNGVTAIEYLAFANCIYLTDIVFPDTVVTIGPSAFSGCTALTSVTLPDGISVIEDSTFNSCRSLSDIAIPDSVVTIGRNAFSNCSSLTSLPIPNSVTTIESSAFEDSGLTDITIPASVTKIEGYAFSNCPSLTRIQVSQNNPSYSSDGIALLNKDQTMLIQYPGGRAGSYSMPDTVTEMTRHAVWFNSGLTELELSSSLHTIPNNAFTRCSSLEHIEFPASLKTMGYYLFANDDAPSYLTFLGSAPAIPDGTPFTGLSTTVYYPKNDPTWTESVRKSFGGDITWIAYDSGNPFTDVPRNSFYYESVMWAVKNGITNGLTETTFGPTASCNRAQVVTFLWRAAGSPEPTVTEHSFVDVQAGSFYEKAVLWAVENGITTGINDTHFGPGAVCNRATVVTFLWRAAGIPDMEDARTPFYDVPSTSWYSEAVLWAVENGITNGLTDTTFGPTTNCNRAQIVTFLYRAYCG